VGEKKASLLPFPEKPDVRRHDTHGVSSTPLVTISARPSCPVGRGGVIGPDETGMPVRTDLPDTLPCPEAKPQHVLTESNGTEQGTSQRA
jgi:hypothetical protein